ncbi:DNA adenine methylase [Lysinibacillus macroides]|uniref:DNA methyltransferase n=1 Tax=Lysinibacillus macroides TaxID=33935 RepID=A0A0M9DHG7_9BACI|nr:DNA adenine methylase [Lysinibacillus macroides]KOY81558.1 DNA methyltransferase [Lysinibacillus macroides]QPR69601.1 DNA adenine methylase [Lysinibacillus macroides]
MSSIPRILHYPGSKWSLADWIISHFPDHETYLEPFFGSGAVLFSKKRSQLETVNDLDGEIVNLFQVIRERPDELAHQIKFTPHSRQEYYNSYLVADNELERARRLIVRLWQGRGGKTSHRTGWRSMIEMNGPLPGKEWLRFPEKIAVVAERLVGVQIENQPAVELIQRYSRQNVLIYADPPYILSTRTTTSYKHEMTNEQHEELLTVLNSHPGPVILSGYENELYSTLLKDWHKEHRQAKAEGGASRIETLYINPVVAEHGCRQQTLF